MKYVICAGGTGGHIYPALAIINKIKSEDKKADILYIGTTDRMEKDIVPSRGIKYKGIEITGLNRKNIFKNIKVFKIYKNAINSAYEILNKFKPDILIGVGGYITLPVCMAAKKLNIPILIHEQNSIPGLSNKIISKYAKAICVSLPGSLKLFPKNKTIYTGNPRSEEIISSKIVKKSSLGFDQDKKLVIIVMGSLGSTVMSDKLLELVPKFENKNYQVLLVTGKAYYDKFKEFELSNVKIVDYYDKLINIMKDSDLIISRAGASTISEICSIGLPSILVPSPYVTHNHQYKNALELENAGACILLEEKDFESDKVINEIDKLFDNGDLYKRMHKASLDLGVRDSGDRIYHVISEIVGDKNG